MIEALLTTVVPALIPAVTDGVRGVIAKFTGGAGAKPANVAEAVQLMNADTDRLRALKELDNVGQVSLWVNNVRAMMRPVASAIVLGGYIGTLYLSADQAVILQMGDYARMVTFYIFGDRSYMYFKRA